MASTRVLTDHEDIRRWAEARHAQPARVKGTGGKRDPGLIRLDFPGFSGEGKLQPISWDEWFKAFDANNLALIVQDETAGGRRSNFNKLVSRETIAAARTRKGAGTPARRRKPTETGARKRAAPARKTAGRSSTRKTGSAGKKKTASRKPVSRKRA
jgi:hypothetical protein